MLIDLDGTMVIRHHVVVRNRNEWSPFWHRVDGTRARSTTGAFCTVADMCADDTPDSRRHCVALLGQGGVLDDQGVVGGDN
jgi:hypothetical protein